MGGGGGRRLSGRHACATISGGARAWSHGAAGPAVGAREQRVRPGDLGREDLLAPLPDDPRLGSRVCRDRRPLIDDIGSRQNSDDGRRLLFLAPRRGTAAQRWQ